MNKLIVLLFVVAVTGLTVTAQESQNDATGSDTASGQLDGEQPMESHERMRGGGMHGGRCRCGPGRRPFGQRGSEDFEARREQRLMEREARVNGTRPFGQRGSEDMESRREQRLMGREARRNGTFGNGDMTEGEWMGLRRRCMRIMGHGRMNNGTRSHGPRGDGRENMEAKEGMGTRRDGMHHMGHGQRGNTTSHNGEENMLNDEEMGPRGEGMPPNGHGPRGNGTRRFHSRGNGTKPSQLSGEGDMQEDEFMVLRRRCMRVMGHGRRGNGTESHRSKGESEGNVALGERLEQSKDGTRPVRDWQRFNGTRTHGLKEAEGGPREDGEIGSFRRGHGGCRCRSMHGRGGPYRHDRMGGTNPDMQTPQTEDLETIAN